MAVDVPLTTAIQSRRGARNRPGIPVARLNRWKELAPDHTLKQIAVMMDTSTTTLRNYAVVTGVKCQPEPRPPKKHPTVVPKPMVCPVMSTLLIHPWTPKLSGALAKVSGKAFHEPRSRQREPTVYKRGGSEDDED